MTVIPQPLDLADPDHHTGQLRRVRIDLDASQRARPDARLLARQPEALGRPVDDLLLQVLEHAEREIQEVAGAAGGVEHRHRAQPLQERSDQPAGLLQGRLSGGSVAIEQALHRRSRLRHVSPQRNHDRRFDQPLDRRAVGVVRPELGAPVRVESPLKERAEDSGLHVSPVEVGGIADRPDLVGSQVDRGRIVEQPPVEPVDPVGPEGPALACHHCEQARQPRVETGGVGVQVLHQALHEPAWKEPGVLREEAEQDPIEEVRHGWPLDTPIGRPQALRQAGEPGGRLFGDQGADHVRSEAVRIAEQCAQQSERLCRTVGQVGQGEGVDAVGGVGEVGVDLELRHVRDHEQRRVVERLAVLQELPVRGGQVTVLLLVLPGEVPVLLLSKLKALHDQHGGERSREPQPPGRAAIWRGTTGGHPR